VRKLFGLIIGILVIVIVIFLALPLGIGFWMKSHYQKILNSVNKSSAIVIKVVDFDRGWFTSKATVQVTIKTQQLQLGQQNMLAGLSKPVQFTMQQRIQNGPLIFGNNKLLWAKALVHSTSSDSNNKFDSKTTIHFGNIVDNIFSTKAITITSGQKQVVIQDVNSQVIFVPKTQHMTSQASIGSITLFEKENTVTNVKKLVLTNVKSNSDIKYVKPLWYGDRSIAVDRSTYFSSTKEPVTINHIIIASKQSQVNTTTASLLAIHANSITTKNINLAPVDLKFSLTGIDTASLSNLIAAVKLDQSQTNKEQLKTLYPASLALLNKGLTATLHYFKFGTPEGPVNATAQLTLPKQAETTNAFSLLQNATGQFYVQMPSAWLKQQLVHLYQSNIVSVVGKDLSASDMANKQIQAWINNKTLIQDESNVKITITFKDGILLINGFPLSDQHPSTTQTAPKGTTLTPQQ